MKAVTAIDPTEKKSTDNRSADSINDAERWLSFNLPSPEEQLVEIDAGFGVSSIYFDRGMPRALTKEFSKLLEDITELISKSTENGEIRKDDIKPKVNDLLGDLNGMIASCEELQMKFISDFKDRGAASITESASIRAPVNYEILIRLINNTSQVRKFFRDFDFIEEDPKQIGAFLNELEHRAQMLKLSVNEAIGASLSNGYQLRL